MRGACEPPPTRRRASELKGKAGPVQSFGGKWKLRVKNQKRLRVRFLLSPDWGAGLGKKKDCSAATTQFQPKLKDPRGTQPRRGCGGARRHTVDRLASGCPL